MERIKVKRPVYDRATGRTVMKEFDIVIDLAKLDWAYQRAFNNAGASTEMAYGSVRVELVGEGAQ